MTKETNLAIYGGKPLRSRPWPQWPVVGKETERVLIEVLNSGRWAVSGPYTGQPSFERKFAESFATYCGVPYCLPVCNGTAGLDVALRALGVGYGQEVLVPGLTWVACASAVIRAGAIPLLVDIDTDTLCMSLQAARQTAERAHRLGAILLVYAFGAGADIDGFLKLSQDTGIPLIEDCSQAHGTLIRGRQVGSYGHIGVFSMQQTKVLTCGEGGAVITSDDKLYDNLQQLRSDGRRYIESPRVGDLEIEEVGTVQGYNYSLSEFGAAILYERLPHLYEQTQVREKNAKYLESLMQKRGLAIPQQRGKDVDCRTYYAYCARLCPKAFKGLPASIAAKAIAAELGLKVGPIYKPINETLLYQPLKSQNLPNDSDWRKRLDPCQYDLPNARAAYASYVSLPHSALLGNKHDMEDIVSAFEKLRRELKTVLARERGSHT